MPSGGFSGIVLGGPQTSTEDAVSAALTLYESALRRYKVEDFHDLSERRQKKFIKEVNQAIQSLGIHDIINEWREQHDKS